MSIDNLQALAARDKLYNICRKWPALQARLQPAKNQDAPHITGTRQPPIPIDIHISDLMHEIETQVARFYAEILVGETDWQPTTSTMPALLHQVATRYGHFTTGDDEAMALGFCDDADHYEHKVTRALEQPEPPAYIGPCQNGTNPGENGCDGELYVRPGHTTGTCPQCGTTFTLTEQRAWLNNQLNDRLMTQTELTRALKILGTPTPPGTIKTWIKRGRLQPATQDTNHPLYRLADAHHLATTRQPKGFDKAS